ncbi:unnamed protein product [Calicophoron daubneyi]|uniref:Uncharacterized protein n=1 Tax=Calicophoron daubneyi TaxID=300641 RepID=A0AAV2TR95_CALDB
MYNGKAVQSLGSRPEVECRCSPSLRSIRDPAEAVALIQDLESEKSKTTDWQSQAKGNRRVNEVKRHLQECLHVAYAQAAGKPNSSRASWNNCDTNGTWAAVLVQSSGSTRDVERANPHLRLTIELPLLDIVSSKVVSDGRVPTRIQQSSLSPVCSAPQQGTHRTPSIEKKSYKIRELEGSPCMGGELTTHRPVEIVSTVYTPREEISERKETSLSVQKTKEIPAEQDRRSYLSSFPLKASITDTDFTANGQIDWDKVEQLENAIWCAPANMNMSNFVRQRSFLSYVKILKKALVECKIKADRLIEEANTFYSQIQNVMTGDQLEKVAHIRILISYTLNEIRVVDANISNPNLLPTDPAQKDDSAARPLLTVPRRVQERYARQVRVIIEMLVMMEELLKSAKGGKSQEPLRLIRRP